MNPIPLLPKAKIQDWPPQSEVGVHSIGEQDYQRNLCEDYYEASDFGTPSPLAQPMAFAERLRQYLLESQAGEGSEPSPAFTTWSLLIQGIYLGVVTLRDVNLDDLKDLGQIVKHELPERFALQFLVFQERVIGLTYPDVGFVASARYDDETETLLRREVNAKDVEKAADYFVGWVHTFDDKDQGSASFYPLLYRVAEAWRPAASPELPRTPGDLFGQGPTLWLDTSLSPSVGKPQIPLYVGTPIICDHCDHEIGTEGLLEVRRPEDCRCPNCQRQQDWLAEYIEWIRFNEQRECYLIYAFESSPLRRPPYEKYVEYEKDGVVIRTGRFALKVYGLILSEDSLKCTRLLFFRDGDKLTEPHLPVRGEYYGMVQLAPGRRPHRDRMSGDYLVALEVEGWDEIIQLRYQPREIEEEEALLLTWPNFNLPGWNLYYLLIETTPQMLAAGMKVRTLDPRSAPRLLDTTRARLEDAFQALEVVFARDGKIEGQAGIFESHRYEVARGESPLTVSLDFGTSSSSLWYKLGDGEATVLRFRDFTETMIPNHVLSERALELSHWLPTYRLNDSKTAEAFYRAQLDSDASVELDAEEIVAKVDYFIPSELIAKPPISEGVLDHPLSGFRICHTYSSRPEGEVIYELKTLDVRGHPEGRYTYHQAVTRYLEFFLGLALATVVRTEERAGHLKVRASFPRAFSSEKVQAFLQCLNVALKRIQDLTGFTTNQIRYIDEARAAALSLQVPHGYSLVMDMGGGTTDIGIFEWEDGELKSHYVDSLLYGANAFLRLLASEDEADLFPKPTEPRHSRLTWLLREIRLRGFDTVVRTQYRGNSHSKDVMLDLLLRFYTPIAYFVARLFEALSRHNGNQGDPRHAEVTYYLVGNGWTLGDAIPAQDSSYAKGHQEVLRYLLERQGFTRLTPAQAPSFDGTAGGWPGPKAAVGYGAIVAPEKLLYRSLEEINSDVNGTRSIAGFDINFTDGRNGQLPMPWHQTIPHRIDKPHYRPLLADVKLPEEWEFIRFRKGAEVETLEQVCAGDIQNIERPVVTRSFLTRFLEHIYISQLPRARRI